ncbi:MAG: flippase, partial [Gammaproteobacteria bacterium]|nr:flippase [Gammaproteobacteria bacterium]
MMADAVSKGLLFLLIILIARNLGDVTFGKYSFTFAFTSLFVVFADFGLSTLTIREIARNREYAGKYLGNISLIKLLLSIITGIFIVISINLLDYPSDTILAVYFAGAYVIVNSFNQFLRAFFRAFEKMEYEAVTRITERILLFIAVASMLHFGYGLVPIISVFFIVSVFNFFVTIVLVLKRFVKPSYEIDLKFCRGIIKEAIPFSLAIAFSAIYFRIDTVMLSLMQSDNVVGWYSAAYQILEGGTMLSVSFVSAIFPFFSKMHNNNEKHKAAFLK